MIFDDIAALFVRAFDLVRSIKAKIVVIVDPDSLTGAQARSIKASLTTLVNDLVSIDGDLGAVDGQTPLGMSNIQVTSVTGEAATVTWSTEFPADSQVEFGLTQSYGSASPIDPAKVVGHAVLLTGLTVSTLYHYRVKSLGDVLLVSGDFTFSTQPGL